MKVLIVSDTHGRDENLEIAVNREAPFDMLVHCGDVEGREFYIEALADCPCSIVSGNNDFFSDLPREDVIDIEGNKVLVTHGHYYGVSMAFDQLADAAKQRGCNAAFFGHIHVPVLEPRKPGLPKATGQKTQLCSSGNGRKRRDGCGDPVLINKKYYIEKKKCRRVVYSATNKKTPVQYLQASYELKLLE